MELMAPKIMSADIYSKVKFPQMRQMLIFSLIDLSNRDVQKNEWVDSSRFNLFWYNIRPIIDLLFDDLMLNENPEDHIGYYLVDKEEALAVKKVTECFEDIFKYVGDEKSDEDYFYSPYWDRLVKSSYEALLLFHANEMKAKETNPVPWGGE